jgi:hypothetical protein
MSFVFISCHIRQHISIFAPNRQQQGSKVVVIAGRIVPDVITGNGLDICSNEDVQQ